MRYFIEMAYDGTNFHGWQRQPNAISVQQVLEDALSKILRRNSEIVGCGRTDTGVHAARYYAHFGTETEVVNPEKLALSLDRMCGKNIAIKKIYKVDDEMHARFSAKKRTYRYLVQYAPNPFMTNRVWLSSSILDIDKMNGCCKQLVASNDFTSFAKLHSDNKTNICYVSHAQWKPWTDLYGTPGIEFEISADRFLRNMVRAIVGTLVDVGRGKLSANDFRAIINAKNRCAAGTSMPACGLYLWNVEY